MKRILLSLLLLTCAATAWAQWSGSVELSGGYGRLTSTDKSTRLHHWLGNGTFRLGYKNAAFQWNTTLGASYEDLTSEDFRISASISDTGAEDVSLASEIKNKLSRPWGINFRSDAIWTPSAGLRHHAYVLYGYKYHRGENLTYKYAGVNDVELSDVYFDLPETKTHQAELGYDFTTRLGSPRKILLGNISWGQLFRNQQTQWLLYQDLPDTPEIAPEVMDIYVIRPQSAQTSIKSAVHLRDSIITAGPTRLLLDYGVRLNGGVVKDRNSGATLISQEPVVWKDSTRLREDFKFLTLTAEPYVAASFRWDKLQVNADYGLQLYARRLTSDLHPSRKLEMVPPSVVGNIRADWNFADGHSLRVGNSLSVKHPDYVQVCWYERQGTYLTQIYRGSNTLESTYSCAFQLGYNYHYKRLRAALTVTATRRLGEVEQTYSNEEIDGKTYQVFTWINASDSWALSLAPQVGWAGKIFKTNIGFTHNLTFRTARAGGERKKSSDWSLWADASLTLKGGWQAVADIRYHSSVSSLFTNFSEYWTLNVKVQKAFKHVTVYLQGRDLLDNPVRKEYLSADQLEWWAEESRLNRRLIVLGAKWIF